jgi:hypothetical protein
MCTMYIFKIIPNVRYKLIVINIVIEIIVNDSYYYRKTRIWVLIIEKRNQLFTL